MSEKHPEFDALNENVQLFVRKHYVSACIRGVLYFFSLLLFLFLFLAVVNFYVWPGQVARTLVFFSCLVMLCSFCWQFVVDPFLKSQTDWKSNDSRAMALVSKHFPALTDRYKNTLQLEQALNELQASPGDRSLFVAGLNQKAMALNKNDFSKAVDLRENRRYLALVFAPLLGIALVSSVWPLIIKQGSERLIHFNREYIKPAPFAFSLISAPLAEQGKPVYVRLSLEGRELPAEVSLVGSFGKLPMHRVKANLFEYTLPGQSSDITFKFEAGPVISRDFMIRIVPKAALSRAQLVLHFPFKTGLSDETYSSSGAFTVPVGTIARWTFNTEHADHISVSASPAELAYLTMQGNNFRYIHKLDRSQIYLFSPLSGRNFKGDFLRFQFNVTADLAPSISVKIASSIPENSEGVAPVHFDVELHDDYGFSSLKMILKTYSDQNKQSISRITVSIPVKPRDQKLSCVLNTPRFLVRGVSRLDVSFEVFDNNERPQASRSAEFSFYPSNHLALAKSISAGSKAIDSRFSNLRTQASQIQQAAGQLQESLANSSSMGLEEKNQAEDLLKKQTALQNDLQSLQNDLHKAVQQNPAGLQENQRELNKRIDDLQEDKTAILLEQIRALMKENSRNQVRESLQSLQQTSQDKEQQLKNLESLVRKELLAHERSRIQSEINSLAEKEQSLAGKPQTQETLETQQQIAREFNRTLEQEHKASAEASEPSQLTDQKSTIARANQDMENAARNLKKSNAGQSSKNEKEAAGLMKEIASNMQQEEAAEQSQNLDQSLSSIRLILENLLRVSFSQEAAMKALSEIHTQDPGFRNLVRKQSDLTENLRLIQDSLQSLAQKVPQIQAFVSREMRSVNSNMKSVVQLLSDYKLYEAAGKEQFIMTSVNNLAVLLSNAEKSLQKARQNMSAGSRGKKSTEGLSGLAGKQKELGEEMAKLKTGSSHTPGSEAFAKLAARQEQIRRELEAMMSEMGSAGKKAGANAGNLMKQNELGLLNKSLPTATGTRQKEIMSRMLEAENAEKSQEQDKARESKTGQNQKISSAGLVIEKHPSARSFQGESQPLLPQPEINSFYKTKINSYFDHLNEGR